MPRAFILLFLAVTFYSVQNLYTHQANQGQVQAASVRRPEVAERVHGFPIRLTIPAIDVYADIQHLGVTAAGEMEVPNNSADVGWFKFGPRPGEIGSSVIAGHFNGENGEIGVFADLSKLKEGDRLYIEDSNGVSTVFVVRESRKYDPGYAEGVFNQSGGTHLNLITCDGVWDENEKSYSKRLVVFADIAN